jgi:acetyl esterase/lipase
MALAAFSAAPLFGTATYTDIAYGAHSAQVMDVYLPAHDEQVPVIVYIHGGAWIKGSKQYVAGYLHQGPRSGNYAVVLRQQPSRGPESTALW